jgi:hypothetical protein
VGDTLVEQGFKEQARWRRDLVPAECADQDPERLLLPGCLKKRRNDVSPPACGLEDVDQLLGVLLAFIIGGQGSDVIGSTGRRSQLLHEACPLLGGYLPRRLQDLKAIADKDRSEKGKSTQHAQDRSADAEHLQKPLKILDRIPPSAH